MRKRNGSFVYSRAHVFKMEDGSIQGRNTRAFRAHATTMNKEHLMIRNPLLTALMKRI